VLVAEEESNTRCAQIHKSGTRCLPCSWVGSGGYGTQRLFFRLPPPSVTTFDFIWSTNFFATRPTRASRLEIVREHHENNTMKVSRNIMIRLKNVPLATDCWADSMVQDPEGIYTRFEASCLLNMHTCGCLQGHPHQLVHKTFAQMAP
jgi:hypothetical protein